MQGIAAGITSYTHTTNVHNKAGLRSVTQAVEQCESSEVGQVRPRQRSQNHHPVCHSHMLPHIPNVVSHHAQVPPLLSLLTLLRFVALYLSIYTYVQPGPHLLPFLTQLHQCVLHAIIPLKEQPLNTLPSCCLIAFLFSTPNNTLCQTPQHHMLVEDIPQHLRQKFPWLYRRHNSLQTTLWSPWSKGGTTWKNDWPRDNTSCRLQHRQLSNCCIQHSASKHIFFWVPCLV